jgi:diaminopimelate decarboxylase
LSEVLYLKPGEQKNFCIIDAAMNDLLRPALYGSYHGIVPVRRELTKGAMKKVDVVGPVCETSDCFAGDRLLSKRLASSDLLAVLSAGAYGFAMSSTYNTRPRGPELLVEDGKVRVLRQRETLEDLIRGESV